MQLVCHHNKLVILSKNLTCTDRPSVKWIMWTNHCFALDGLCFMAIGILSMDSFRQQFVWQPGCSHKAFIVHLLFTDSTVIWCFVIRIGWASPRPLQILSSAHLLCIGFPPSSSFQSYCHYSIHYDYSLSVVVNLIFQNYLFIPTPPSSLLPHQYPMVSCFISIWGLIIRQINMKEKV